MLNNEILLKAFFHKFHIWRWNFLVYGPCVLTLSPIASAKNIKKSFLIRFSHSVVQSTHLSASLFACPSRLFLCSLSAYHFSLLSCLAWDVLVLHSYII